MRLLRLHDEGSEHAHHFLHRHMGVIEVSARLMQSEFVNETSTWLDRLLANAGTAVHVVWNLETVPVHGSGFRQMVVHDESDAISLIDLNRWARRAAIESPQREGLIGCNLLLYRLCNQMEHFDATVQGEWQIWYIGGLHRHTDSPARTRPVIFVTSCGRG